MHDGGHVVDFQKTDVASQLTAPSKSFSHYDSTTPVIDDKVLISLSPASSDVCVSDPPDYQKDLVFFVFNNLSPCNLPNMVAEFSESAHAHLLWVTKYLV